MLIRSFKNALKGIKTVFKEERNFRIQIIVAVVVVVLMQIFSLGVLEKSILILLILIVLLLELFNSIIERFSDIVKPRIHTYIKDIKNIAAGAVFIAALASFIIGIIIFYPHICEILIKFVI